MKIASKKIKLNEVFSPNLPEWLVKDKYINQALLKKGINLAGATYTPVNKYLSLKDPIFKDNTKLLVWVIGRQIYIPGVTNPTLSLGSQYRAAAKTSLAKIQDAASEFGYIDLADPSNITADIKKARAEAISGSIERGKGQYAYQPMEYAKDEEGNMETEPNSWGRPTKTYRQVPNGPMEYPVTKGQDKSGYPLPDPYKYVKILNTVNKDNYGDKLEIVYAKIRKAQKDMAKAIEDYDFRNERDDSYKDSSYYIRDMADCLKKAVDKYKKILSTITELTKNSTPSDEVSADASGYYSKALDSFFSNDENGNWYQSFAGLVADIHNYLEELYKSINELKNLTAKVESRNKTKTIGKIYLEIKDKDEATKKITPQVYQDIYKDKEGKELLIKLKDIAVDDPEYRKKRKEIINQLQDKFGYIFENKTVKEAYVPSNIKEFASRKGVSSLVRSVAGWVEKASKGEKRITGGTAIGKYYNTLILDIKYQGSEIYINTDDMTVEFNGTEVTDYKSFKAAWDEYYGSKEEVTEGKTFRRDDDYFPKDYRAQARAADPEFTVGTPGKPVTRTDKRVFKCKHDILDFEGNKIFNSGDLLKGRMTPEGFDLIGVYKTKEPVDLEYLFNELIPTEGDIIFDDDIIEVTVEDRKRLKEDADKYTGNFKIEIRPLCSYWYDFDDENYLNNLRDCYMAEDVWKSEPWEVVRKKVKKDKIFNQIKIELDKKIDESGIKLKNLFIMNKEPVSYDKNVLAIDYSDEDNNCVNTYAIFINDEPIDKEDLQSIISSINTNESLIENKSKKRKVETKQGKWVQELWYIDNEEFIEEYQPLKYKYEVCIKNMLIHANEEFLKEPGELEKDVYDDIYYSTIDDITYALKYNMVTNSLTLYEVLQEPDYPDDYDNTLFKYENKKIKLVLEDTDHICPECHNPWSFCDCVDVEDAYEDGICPDCGMDEDHCECICPECGYPWADCNCECNVGVRCDKCGEDFDNCTCQASENIKDLLPEKYIKENNDTYKYQLLSRLQSDCDYFLGYGNRNEKHLWALGVNEQIAKMKELYNSFPDNEKPEWISMEDIENYEKRMKNNKEVLPENKITLDEDAWQDIFADKDQSETRIIKDKVGNDYVLYYEAGEIYGTPLDNYNQQIRNQRLITKWQGFDNLDQVEQYISWIHLSAKNESKKDYKSIQDVLATEEGRNLFDQLSKIEPSDPEYKSKRKKLINKIANKFGYIYKENKLTEDNDLKGSFYLLGFDENNIHPLGSDATFTIRSKEKSAQRAQAERMKRLYGSKIKSVYLIPYGSYTQKMCEMSDKEFSEYIIKNFERIA